MAEAPTLADVLLAARRLRGVVLRTPLLRSDWLSDVAGVEVHLKVEAWQRTGAFKLRGALNAVAALSDEARSRGVVAASAGNHGLGVAAAARLHGVPATVFVTDAAPEAKRRRIRRLGGEVREAPGSYEQVQRVAQRFTVESGGVLIHGYSHPDVAAGQGTIGLEVLEELPGARTLLVPAGGGGLIGGVGTVARAADPSIRVVGASTHETSALAGSLERGELFCPPPAPTLCEGLAGETDERAVALARRVADDFVLVTETAVRRAIRALFVEEGIVAEGSAAVVIAALLEGAVPDLRGPVVAVVSGGNVEPAVLAEILSDEDDDD